MITRGVADVIASISWVGLGSQVPVHKETLMVNMRVLIVSVGLLPMFGCASRCKPKVARETQNRPMKSPNDGQAKKLVPFGGAEWSDGQNEPGEGTMVHFGVPPSQIGDNRQWCSFVIPPESTAYQAATSMTRAWNRQATSYAACRAHLFYSDPRAVSVILVPEAGGRCPDPNQLRIRIIEQEHYELPHEEIFNIGFEKGNIGGAGALKVKHRFLGNER